MLLRGLLMILAAIAVEISIFLLYVMTVAHFFYQLVMAKPLDRVTELCGRLSAFSHKLLDFIGYHSDKPVFPFAPFPEASPQDEDEKKAKK